jgi:penicillin-insensitive murein endopeptidase
MNLIPLNARCLLLLLFAHTVEAAAGTSRCFGTVGNGRIEGSVKLPTHGPNFAAYSAWGTTAGRTYVHSKVADVVVSAYATLASTAPDATFVYGETGLASGGRFRPHRTHQNGLSIDFFVPVRDETGKSKALPTSVGNRFGYDIEFDSSAKYGKYRIDFPAISEHLYQLDSAAKAHGIGIKLVIFDSEFMPRLLATPRGPYLRENLQFMKGKPWVRHDEHYHVDFAVPCKP